MEVDFGWYNTAARAGTAEPRSDLGAGGGGSGVGKDAGVAKDG